LWYCTDCWATWDAIEAELAAEEIYTGAESLQSKHLETPAHEDEVSVRPASGTTKVHRRATANMQGGESSQEKQHHGAIVHDDEEGVPTLEVPAFRTRQGDRVVKANMQGAGVLRSCEACASVLSGPLVYKVRQGPVQIHASANPESSVVGMLCAGDKVEGIPGGFWLSLVGKGDREASWVPLYDWSDERVLQYNFEAQWSRPVSITTGPGTIEIEWNALPARDVVYSAELCHAWKAEKASQSVPTQRMTMLLEPRACFSQLGKCSQVHVRLEAKIPCEIPRSPSVCLLGSWSDSITVPANDSMLPK
jgi:hypothetical protein